MVATKNQTRHQNLIDSYFHGHFTCFQSSVYKTVLSAVSAKQYFTQYFSCTNAAASERVAGGAEDIHACTDSATLEGFNPPPPLLLPHLRSYRRNINSGSDLCARACDKIPLTPKPYTCFPPPHGPERTGCLRNTANVASEQETKAGQLRLLKQRWKAASDDMGTAVDADSYSIFLFFFFF